MDPRGPTHLEELIAQAAGLRRLAVRLVGESDADDVLQDTVAAGLEHAPGDPRALRPWLTRVVRNFAAGRHRGQSASRAREAAAARSEALQSTGDLVERMEVQRVVAEEVLRLDEPYRTAVLAVYFDGASAEDYARRLGIPGATVRSWLKRGLESLRARLDRRFGGRREAWSACLLPLTRPESTLVPLAIGGGILMKKLAIAAIVLFVAVLAWWSVAGESGPQQLEVARTHASVELGEPGGSAPSDLHAAAGAGERRVGIAAAPSTPAVGAGRVTGRVTWSPDGAPAVDVGVRLVSALDEGFGEDPPQAVTDRDGRFAFSGIAPGNHEVRLDRSMVARAIVVESGDAHDAELAIPRVEDVLGRVLDQDGVPVPGAEVHIEVHVGWTRRVATADANGAFRFEGAETWVSFFARAPGRAPSGMRQAPQKSPRSFDLYLGGPSGSVVGVVLDARGEPYVGARVALNLRGNGFDPAGTRVQRGGSCASHSDAAGRFDFRDVEPGPSTLSVLAPGFPWVETAVLVRPGLASESEVRLPSLVRVRGRVTRADGQPLQGARINASSPELGRVWTTLPCGPDGRFDTGAVPAGRVWLAAADQSGGVELLETVLAPGADFEWSPVIPRPKSIRGRLVDLAGAPLAARSVSLSEEKRTTTTGTDGRFVFDACTLQEYSVWFAEGSLSTRRAIAVPGGAEVLLVAEEANARVVGRVVDQLGRPRARVGVECDRARASSGADGSFELTGLRSGQSLIGASLQTMHGFTLATLDVRPGALHDIGAVVLPENGSLRVRVRSDEGVPIGWTSPSLRRVGPGEQWVYVQGWNPRGEWTHSSLPAGDYELGVREGGAALQQQLVSIRAGERTEVELDLRFGTRVQVEAAVPIDAPPFVEVEVEFRDTAGAVVGHRTLKNPYGTTMSTEEVALAPGTYECAARTDDGRAGSVRLVVGRDGALRARIDLR